MTFWQGEFDKKLWETVGGAKNVLLVWTKGCMDRFLDDADPTNQGANIKQLSDDRAFSQADDIFQILCGRSMLLPSN